MEELREQFAWDMEKDVSVRSDIVGVLVNINPIGAKPTSSGPFAKAPHALLKLDFVVLLSVLSVQPVYRNKCIEGEAVSTCKTVCCKKTLYLPRSKSVRTTTPLIGILALPGPALASHGPRRAFATDNVILLETTIERRIGWH